MPDPSEIFAASTAGLFGGEQPLGEAGGGSVLVSAAATSETGGVVVSSPVSSFPAAPPFLTELQRRNQQIEQQDYP